MKAADFVKVLSTYSPAAEELRNAGLSDSEAESFRLKYICRQTKKPSCDENSDELINFITRWDTSKIEIGMLWFRENHPIYLDRGIQVGSFEVDPLIINKNLEIIIEEEGIPGRILWKAARSSEQFLDSIALAAKFLGECAVGLVDPYDLKAANRHAITCAELAGGDTYLDFYLMMLGAE